MLGSYSPNPLLCKDNHDYLKPCEFSIDITEVKINSNQIRIIVIYNLKSKSISHLVESGKAEVGVKLKCSNTNFSRWYPFQAKSHRLEIEINSQTVLYKIEVIGEIDAKRKIRGFTGNGELNSEIFEGVTPCEFEEGEPLALDEGHSIPVEIEQVRSVHAIFRFYESPDDDAENLLPNFLGQCIEIQLNRESMAKYRKWKDIKDPKIQTQMSSDLILPVLTDAVYIVLKANQNQNNNDYKQYSSYKWFMAIETKARNLGIDLSSKSVWPSQVVNRILDDHAQNALNFYDSIFDNGAYDDSSVEGEIL